MPTVTENPGIKIGDKAPDFKLLGIDNKEHSLNDYKDKDILVIIFMCNHCPYVQAYIERLIKLQDEFEDKVQVVGINSNDETNYPDDRFDMMVTHARIRGYTFDYLRDADQSVAKAYGAQCTPEVFVFDKERKLKYYGRIDDNYQDSNAVKSPDLGNAVQALVEGNEVPIPVTHAMGCSIKWSD